MLRLERLPKIESISAVRYTKQISIEMYKFIWLKDCILLRGLYGDVTQIFPVWNLFLNSVGMIEIARSASMQRMHSSYTKAEGFPYFPRVPHFPRTSVHTGRECYMIFNLALYRWVGMLMQCSSFREPYYKVVYADTQASLKFITLKGSLSFELRPSSFSTK